MGQCACAPEARPGCSNLVEFTGQGSSSKRLLDQSVGRTREFWDVSTIKGPSLVGFKRADLKLYRIRRHIRRLHQSCCRLEIAVEL